MDKLEEYRQVICSFLKEQGEIIPINGTIETETIFARETDRYLLLHLGWNNQQRIYAVIIHLEVREGKVWIQQNTTDFSIAEELLERGIVREDIVLGLKPAFVREYTGFGVA
ncbi:XisI protein [Oscillatoria salina]|uniref:XisI protein n=1 Tax=Oscillatoria salina TaxID=331517 RepID=UPI001CD0065A|nr:XisI protein [Oscillatoria salina]MBZ8183133.1 XisI protein [Oscillatoria salina IIICB1]